MAIAAAPRFRGLRGWFFAFFFVSGLCSLVDEVVWLRLTMAAFGVTTPMVSIVLSVFMGGLALGSWGAGRLIRESGPSAARRGLRAYALAELVIGLSALVVPAALGWGQTFMERAGERVAWASSLHYLVSGGWISAVLLPFTAAMGATFPLGMSALRPGDTPRPASTFSYLYLANVLGAAAGTLLSAFVLIEFLGFRRTLLGAAGLNLGLAAAAFALSFVGGGADASEVKEAAATKPPVSAKDARTRSADRVPADRHSPRRGHEMQAAAVPGRVPREPSAIIPWLLFMTGLISMAMEVVWVRQYTPFLGTVVYSFALILAIYLFATFLGSTAYRRWARSHPVERSDGAWVQAWILIALFAVLTLVVVDPRVKILPGPLRAIARLALGIGPFCAAVGFLTPMLVDRWSAGDPRRAGSAYAVNVVGCILGPLVAGFLLLPFLGERFSVVALALPSFAIALLLVARSDPLAGVRATLARKAAWGGAVALAVGIVAFSRDFESMFPRREVLRDYAATVIATGEGMYRRLLVNGVGMTKLTPITKMMVHLPIAFLPRPPENSLVICFGMGTTFRSALAWEIPCTSVELVPSVPRLFRYYHADADRAVREPGARIVIDDGRRFLARTPTRYDLITVDPPPPVEAAGSSLLYSKEFYALAKSRLSSDGIMSVWFPGGESMILCSAAKAVAETFPYVRAFQSVEGWGLHLLASNRPIRAVPPQQLAARLPPRAAADLVEWTPNETPEALFRTVLEGERPVRELLDLVPNTPTLVDDRPINEYFLARRLLWGSSAQAR